MGVKGTVASTAGLAVLLAEGIGDTIRVSLTPDPGAPREREVEIAQEVLQALGCGASRPASPPAPAAAAPPARCSRRWRATSRPTSRRRCPAGRSATPASRTLKVAVMGCIVNGPGESKHADIGISLPGTGESPKAPVYRDGAFVTTLQGDDIVGGFNRMLDEYVEERFGGGRSEDRRDRVDLPTSDLTTPAGRPLGGAPRESVPGH
jgi:(E)-4-hydroxy-3-methylbut-2-enyl-diphosphate synthase